MPEARQARVPDYPPEIPAARPRAGEYLKAVRERLQLGVRDVQEASSVIAAEESNENFYISAARLNQLENEESIPSVFKLFTLCSVYGLDFHDVLTKYGINANRARAYRTRFLAETTRPVAAEIYGFEEKVLVPVRIDPTFRLETTQLINRAVAMWGEVPAAFLTGFNPRRHTYGYVGLGDRRMYPLLRPGSLVMVDPERRRVARDGWQNEYDRPLYFVELRDGYRCGWCQVDGARLLLIPHPDSKSPVETFSLSTEADVLGQVVGVAMRLLPSSNPSPELVPKLPGPIGIAR